jgi:hypothetical protein
MGSVRRRLRLRAVFAIAVAALTLSAAQASGAKAPAGATCNWGASSERAQVVDGRIVTSPPAQTGCSGR